MREFLVADGAWDVVEVLAEAQDRSGSTRLLVRWWDDRASHEDWLMAEEVKLREIHDNGNTTA